MSTADRDRWNARYADGAYESRRHPSPYLEQNAHLLPETGRALDLACGAGRNAIYLANRGFAVDAVDISRVALEQGRADAGELPIRWIECDLDDGFGASVDYDLIVNIRYVNLPLVSTLLGSLSPGGVLIIEQHLATAADVVGPKNPAYRVDRGDLGRVANGMIIERIDERLIDDPDGRRAALARLVARKPGRSS
ncbi:MAG: methyltransferase domain-containing protein [Gammaproteobacteria bacterium]|nr:methyltransferase domain-containing protein [Gammaproteobacteria bacterium]MYF27289.1 methyltransferase domain-containing protein [Gammaproteobacteria bacterium]MYK45335.1 methyltransferase domain-containing protein [Gammaproteobacteria bacterium]